MTTSILLRAPSRPSPSPSPSPASTPLPALQTDLSSSPSSSSPSGSSVDLNPSASAPSSRRIRFAPLPDPRRDGPFGPHDPSEDPQLDSKPSLQSPHTPDDLPDGVVPLSPSVSPVSTLSSTRSTPTIRTSSKNTPKSGIKLLRPFSFLRNTRSSPSHSPLPHSDVLPNVSRSSTSLPNSPSLRSSKLPRIPTEDTITGTNTLFRAPSESASSTRSLRPYSPLPTSSDPSASLHRSASTGSAPRTSLTRGLLGWAVSSNESSDAAAIAGSGPKKRRASSSALTPGAGGGRHPASVKSPPNEPPRPSTAPNSPTVFPKKHVKMLNGRVYGAKRYAAQTLANPFANVREEPEFVEWGYGGMGSVHASVGVGNDVWKGLQRSERGGALLAGSSFDSPARPAARAGGGRGSGASANVPIARRKMSSDVPECSMGSVGVAGDEDDGSGMGWVKRRRAEKEAKARLEQNAKELDKKPQEGRKSGDSMDASMYASTASTTTLLTTCTSAASTGLTTPASSPLVSRSPSLMDLNVASSPLEPCDLHSAPSSATGDQPRKFETSPPLTSSNEHSVLTAVRLSPSISTSSHKHSHSATHGRTPSLSATLSNINDDERPEQAVRLSPIDTEEATTSANSFEDEEPSRDDDDDVDDDEDELQDTRRKTALGAGVEKFSRHVDTEAR